MTRWTEAHDSEVTALRYFATVCAAVVRARPTPPLPRGVDPSRLVALAARHRIAAPVFERLALEIDPVDRVISATCEARARHLRFAALHRTQRLIELSRALSNQGVEHIAIKGPALSQQLYGDVTARDSKDIDLLIKPAHFDAATHVFEGLGFTSHTNQGETGINRTLDHAPKHRTFRSQTTEIEAHSRLLDTVDFVALPFDHVWARRVPVQLGGTNIPALSPVDTLLYLCAHGTEHCWFRLKWLQDIARIVVLGTPDVLADAIAVAQRDGYDRIVTAALQLVGDLFAIVPSEGGVGAPDWATRRLVALSRAALAAPAELASEPSLGWLIRRSGVQIGLRRQWRYRLAFVEYLFTSPRSFDSGRLQAGPRWLAGLGRPIRLLRHHARGAGRRRIGG